MRQHASPLMHLCMLQSGGRAKPSAVLSPTSLSWTPPFPDPAPIPTRYRRLRDWVKHIYGSPDYAELVRYINKTAAERGVPEGFIADIIDGTAFKELRTKGVNGVPMNVTDIIIGIFTDGVQLFKHNRKYSVYPVAATCYNFPPHLR